MKPLPNCGMKSVSGKRDYKKGKSPRKGDLFVKNYKTTINYARILYPRHSNLL